MAAITRLAPPKDVRQQLWDDVREGLSAQPKRLPSKWFYDARGSELFERITRLPEYYLTRAETAILEHSADAIVAEVAPEEITELGSGSSRKTRLLLEALQRHDSGNRYVPIDVSEPAIDAAARALEADHPWLEVHGLVGDFASDLERLPRRGRRLVALLGSTIGNFDEAGRAHLFVQLRRQLQGGDRFLLGLDLVKDPLTLESAYDDAQGVTAEFNRNVLRVVNRELGADLPVADFEHVARWEPERFRMEMSLRATRAHRVRFAGRDFEVSFAEGEELHTEISCKFTREGLEAEIATAGLTIERWDTDRQQRFALALLAAA